MALAEFHRAEAFRSLPSEHVGPGVDALKKMLRRRDNLEDYVDGLIKTEIFPYPDGEREIIPATYVPVQEVTWKIGALEELTTLSIPEVKHKVDGVEKQVTLTITLTPAFGVGTFELDCHVVKDNADSTALSQGDVERVRMAMWARYEWVKEKIEYINYLRSEVGTDEVEEASDLESNPSEEADPYNSDLDSDDGGSPFNDGFNEDDTNNNQVLFPDASQLAALDMHILRQLFDKKELESLHNTIKAQHDSFKLPQSSKEATTDLTVPPNSTKRKREEDDMIEDRKRSRSDFVENVRNSFLDVAQSLPNARSTGEDLRAFRAAVGNLHINARLLELDETLKEANLPDLVKAKEDAKETETETEGERVRDVVVRENGTTLGSPILGPSTAAETRYVTMSDDIPEGPTATALLQSQYDETQVNRTVDAESGFHDGMEALREADLSSDLEWAGLQARYEEYPAAAEAEELMQIQYDDKLESDWAVLREHVLEEEEMEQTWLNAYSDVPHPPEVDDLIWTQEPLTPVAANEARFWV